jgi:hypothetical protein
MVCTEYIAKRISYNIHYVNYAILFNHYNDLAFVGAMQFLQTTRCSGCAALTADTFTHLHISVSRA